MRKVMVVDDEKWVRRGLIQSIPWDKLGLQLVGEAADGQDAYDMALELRPDLLFLDMRMPGLDGRELLARMDAELPELLTIVVSGYSDFEYTKQAIIHHAFDYLLKPVKKDELAEVLDKAVVELERREGERRKVEEANRSDGWFRDLLLERAGQGRESGSIPASWAGKAAAVFVVQADLYRDDQGGGAVLLRSLRDKLVRERAFYFGGAWEAALSPLPDGRSGAVGAVAVASGQLPPGELKRLLEAVQAELKRLAGCGYSIGVCETALAEAGWLKRALEQALAALAGRKLSEKEAVLLASVSAAGAGSSVSPPYPHRHEQAFLLALQMGNREEAEREFELLLRSIGDESATVGQLKQGAILLVHALERHLRANDSGLEQTCGKPPLELIEALRDRGDPGSVRALFVEELIPAMLASIQQQGATQGELIVREMQRMIESHYDQPLSLQHIAESRFVNADYLSRLFKKMTGQNFVDYLADTRIRKAIELMRVPTYKNYEIARKVGYEDYRYFSQIFKKKTGKTLGEFRSSLE